MNSKLANSPSDKEAFGHVDHKNVEPLENAFDVLTPEQSQNGNRETVRITLDLTKSVHRKLKIHVANEGITIAEYLRSLLEERL
ncbi:hypothetical protein TH19_03365 [Thalassospira profundimaris]|uniref:Chromosome partitioning protein ParB n=1 Tax=Thalassospira profundimaris TaxID=502049 RepID=A0A367WE57_9PROT|nr:hypothetical protein TH19_03365 [Thalassospira profundimaris]